MHWDQIRAGVYERVAYGCANAARIRPDIAYAADIRHWQRWWSPSCNGHHASPRHAVYARPADTDTGDATHRGVGAASVRQR